MGKRRFSLAMGVVVAALAAGAMATRARADDLWCLGFR